MSYHWMSEMIVSAHSHIFQDTAYCLSWHLPEITQEMSFQSWQIWFLNCEIFFFLIWVRKTPSCQLNRVSRLRSGKHNSGISRGDQRQHQLHLHHYNENWKTLLWRYSEVHQCPQSLWNIPSISSPADNRHHQHLKIITVSIIFIYSLIFCWLILFSSI